MWDYNTFCVTNDILCNIIQVKKSLSEEVVRLDSSLSEERQKAQDFVSEKVSYQT